MKYEEKRWKEFESLHENLLRVQRPEIRVKAFTGVDPIAAKCRGLLGHHQNGMSTTDEPEGTSVSFNRLSIATLKIDDFVNFEFISKKPGYLHLLNLGIAGSVSMVFPIFGEKPPVIRKDTPSYYTVNDRDNLLTEDPDRAVSDIQEKGPMILGGKERFLAIVTEDSGKLEISSFNPAWVVDLLSSEERSVPWGSMTTKSASFVDRPIATWSWGWCEYGV